MGNCPFFLEVHCEAHEIPELVRAPLSLSPPSRPWTEGPGSTPGSWHQWLQRGWGTMSTPRGASQRHGVPCGHPGSSLSDCGSSLDILKRHFPGPRLGPQFTRGENCPPQMSLCSSLSDWGGGGVHMALWRGGLGLGRQPSLRSWMLIGLQFLPSW